MSPSWMASQVLGELELFWSRKLAGGVFIPGPMKTSVPQAKTLKSEIGVMEQAGPRTGEKTSIGQTDQ